MNFGTKKTNQHFHDLPCPAERSRGAHWGCTESASASESYPKTQHRRGEEKHEAKQTNLKALDGIRSYPLFHDIISMVGHFFHYAEGSCMDRKDKTYMFMYSPDDPPGRH